MGKLAIAATTLTLTVGATFVQAEEPGRGHTAGYEIKYLQFIADHHYAALRMTELAAGTDATRDPAIAAGEGTSPTPNTEPVSAKAASDELKSMARMENRMQREEIMKAQGLLRDWYGIEYQPRIRWMNAAQIAYLEQAPPGSLFDHYFMEVMSRHHFTALEPSIRCQVASDIAHEALHRYCSNIVHAQLSEIKDMREMLCKNFSICDYQPTVGLKGRHSNGDGAALLDVQADAPPED